MYIVSLKSLKYLHILPLTAKFLHSNNDDYDVMKLCHYYENGGKNDAASEGSRNFFVLYPQLIILEAESFKLWRLTGLTAYVFAGLAN